MNSKKFAKRMKDSGVSPVIATILMVAITVVLAAVLYVMVSGFTHSPGTAQSAGLNEQAGTATNSWTVTVSSVSASNIPVTGLKIVVTVGSNTWTFPYVAGGTWTATSGSSLYPPTLAYSQQGTTYLSAGDTFTITGSGSGSTATPSLVGATVTLYNGGSTLGSVSL